MTRENVAVQYGTRLEEIPSHRYNGAYAHNPSA